MLQKCKIGKKKAGTDFMGRAQVSLIHCNDLVKASPVVVCPAAERATLDFLRTSYQTCRTKPRHDIFAACDLLTCDRHFATTTYAEAVLRTLPQTLGRRPMILRPGDVVVTFDESWLLGGVHQGWLPRHPTRRKIGLRKALQTSNPKPTALPAPRFC